MISRRHRIVERFLSEVLDLPWEQVYKETKKWENVLSPVTEEAMLKFWVTQQLVLLAILFLTQIIKKYQ